MRTSSLIAIAAAAAANAGYTEKYGKYTCDEPNTSYCLAGDIILRCDAYGNGTPGRCSDNLSGYPPAGAVASCYEKPGTVGQAACEKNCVVYGEYPYTLPAELCHPAYTTTTYNTLTTIYTTPTHPPTNKPPPPPVFHNTTSPYPPKPTGPGKPGKPGKPSVTVITKTTTVVYPCPTEPGSMTTKTITYTVPTNVPVTPITKTTTIVYPCPTEPSSLTTKTITYTVPCNSTYYEPPHNPPKTYHPPKPSSPPVYPNGTCPDCPGGKPPHNPPNTTTVYPPKPPKPSSPPSHNETCADCPEKPPYGKPSYGGKGPESEHEGGGKGSYPGGSGDEGDSSHEEYPEPSKAAAHEGTRLPVGPTAAPDTIPTAGATMNAVSGLLAIAGIAAAYLI